MKTILLDDGFNIYYFIQRVYSKSKNDLEMLHYFVKT